MDFVNSDPPNRSLEFYGESQIVALDISKAFDQVWHAALLNKLPSYGLSQTVYLDWWLSFQPAHICRGGRTSIKSMLVYLRAQY